MIRRIRDAGFRPVQPAARRNISLDTEHRFDVSGESLCIKLDGTEHIAVVGNRHSFHFKLLATLEQLTVFYCTIQQRILTM